MANSRQSATIFSPSSKRPTKRTRSSITEHSFQGITSSPKGKKCHPCVRYKLSPMCQAAQLRQFNNLQHFLHCFRKLYQLPKRGLFGRFGQLHNIVQRLSAASEKVNTGIAPQEVRAARMSRSECRVSLEH